MEREKLRGIKFVPSGSTLLNLVLGGGWPIGRIVNVVGDRSVGKTLLAIEACANFAAIYDAHDILYIESEAAFDEDFAARLGMPTGLQINRDVATVEQFYSALTTFLAGRRKETPCLCILDSLDALSDDSEMGREIGEASYGASKARKLSEMFRRVTDNVSRSECLLMIISQVRDNIGVTFGETKTRSGGRALDFYASIALWLSEVGKIKRTVRTIDRIIGMQIKARCKKNKISLPHREAEIALMYNYGLDDEESMLNFLSKSKITFNVDEVRKQLIAGRKQQDRPEVRRIQSTLEVAVTEVWNNIEASLAPPMRKYE